MAAKGEAQRQLEVAALRKRLEDAESAATSARRTADQALKLHQGLAESVSTLARDFSTLTQQV